MASSASSSFSHDHLRLLLEMTYRPSDKGKVEQTFHLYTEGLFCDAHTGNFLFHATSQRHLLPDYGTLHAKLYVTNGIDCRQQIPTSCALAAKNILGRQKNVKYINFCAGMAIVYCTEDANNNNDGKDVHHRPRSMRLNFQLPWHEWEKQTSSPLHVLLYQPKMREPRIRAQLPVYDDRIHYMEDVVARYTEELEHLKQCREEIRQELVAITTRKRKREEREEDDEAASRSPPQPPPCPPQPVPMDTSTWEEFLI